MTYAEQAAEAKAAARDILRTQMAARIQARISEAEGGLISAVKAAANLVARFAKEDKKAAEEATKRAEARDAFSQSLGSVEGVTADELKLVSDAVAKQQAENDKEEAEAASRRAADREAEQKDAADGITAARKELTRHQGNLAKLESGEMKVDAEELKTLAAKLLEEGRIEAGEATTAEQG